MEGLLTDDIKTLDQRLCTIVGKYGRRKTIVPATRLYRDLGIWGDDALELLEEIHQAFGTKFETLDISTYFPYEGEAGPFWLERLLRLKDHKRTLTFGHLLEVVKKGEWFDPVEK
jgi:hypothetical protein